MHTIEARRLKWVVAEVETLQKDLGDIFDDLAKRMVSSITDADINKLNAYQRTVSAAIATDKAQLLKGRPTENLALLIEAVEIIRDQRDRASEAYVRKWRDEHGGLPALATDSLPVPE